jgi:CheY-like chemotaxis protein
MGHETFLAGSGEQCLEIMKERGFDMILMDIELPGMTGMGTTKAIRTLPDREKAATPVIALSGNTRNEDVRTCYAANMNGHLPKPVDPKKLRNTIEKVIKKQLDNPVVLGEAAPDKSSSVTQVKMGAAPASSAPAQSPQQPESPAGPGATPRPVAPVQEKLFAAEKPAAKSGAFIRREVPSDIGKLGSVHQNAPSESKVHAAQARAKDKDAAPIAQFAFDGEEGADGIAFSEDELAGDSFAEAMAMDEKARSHANGAANGSDVFDMKFLKNLRASVGAAALGGLVDDLFGKADEIVVALQAAAKDGNTAEAALRAHELKGMAGNFGLLEMSRLASDAEKAAKENQPVVLAGLVSSLPEANQRAKSSLADWMRSSG